MRQSSGKALVQHLNVGAKRDIYELTRVGCRGSFAFFSLNVTAITRDYWMVRRVASLKQIALAMTQVTILPKIYSPRERIYFVYTHSLYLRRLLLLLLYTYSSSPFCVHLRIALCHAVCSSLLA